MKFEGEEIIRVALKVTAVCQGASFSVSGLCTDQIETSTPPSFHPPVQTVGIWTFVDWIFQIPTSLG